MREREREREHAGIKVKGNLFAVFSYPNDRYREDEVSLTTLVDSNHINTNR